MNAVRVNKEVPVQLDKAEATQARKAFSRMVRMLIKKGALIKS